MAITSSVIKGKTLRGRTISSPAAGGPQSRTVIPGQLQIARDPAVRCSGGPGLCYLLRAGYRLGLGLHHVVHERIAVLGRLRRRARAEELDPSRRSRPTRPPRPPAGRRAARPRPGTPAGALPSPIDPAGVPDLDPAARVTRLDRVREVALPWEHVLRRSVPVQPCLLHPESPPVAERHSSAARPASGGG